MPCPTVYIPKFVGAISLGLLTGTSYASSQISLPPLLSLPSLTPALSSFAQLRQRTSRQQNILSIISVSSLMLAFLRSPRHAKHPYLIWTSLAIVGGSLTKYLVLDEEKARARLGDGEADMREALPDDLNGEIVAGEMDTWRRGQILVGGIWGLAWTMVTIGIWGDWS